MRHSRLIATVVLVLSLAVPGSVAAAAPAAGNDQAATSEDTPVTIDVLKNDSDPDGDVLRVESIIQGSDGFATLTPVAGLISFSPRRDFAGTASFSYVVADPGGATSTGLVMVFVRALNDRPVAGSRAYGLDEDGSITVLFTGMDPDPERCDLQFITELQTGFGTLTPLADAGCTPNGDFATAVYTPFPNYHGPDQISYVVSDGFLQSEFATISLQVNPSDDLPVALPGSATATAGTPVTITLRGFDWETCELVFVVLTTTPHGKLTLPVDEPCGPGGPFDQHVDAATITYTPEPTFSGVETMTFAVSDGTRLSAPATVSIDVAPAPRVHVADLDRSAVKGSGSWQATATIRIHTAAHALQPGAVVQGVWSSGASGTCTTTSAGSCSIASGPIAQKLKSTRFTVTSVTFGSAAYEAVANHDPDGDSTGTSIDIARP